MSVRSRVSAWLEDTLPWYDKPGEDAKYAQFEAQLVDSRKVRAEADQLVEVSRRDRRQELRSSFRQAGRRLGGL